MTVSITNGPATTMAFTTGNDDGVFAISAAGAITIASTTNLNYETTTSYTLGVVAYDTITSDVESVTISITDANDQTPTYTAGSTTVSVAEGSTAAIDSFTITDTDTVGALACAESGNDADDFSCAISGSTLTVSWSATPDYDAATDSDTDNVYAYTITVGDGANDAASTTYAVTVTDTNDQAPVWTTSATASVAEGATAVATLAATDTQWPKCASCRPSADTTWGR